ncbi:MAG: hypothetical protein IJF40_06880 [Clostridia bacterium]|nr:hypothetical protein [Clostridia bacterium]MBQ7047207.1 hypothetical protein [Oscillospiraceae bacterium]
MLLAKIIAAIMAFFMALIPGYTPPEEKPTKPPVVVTPSYSIEVFSDDVRVATSSTKVMNYDYNKSYVIISSYDAWKATGLGKSDKIYTKAFFETNSLAVCGLSLPGSNVKLTYVNAIKVSDTLYLGYTVKEKSDIGAAVMTYKDIIVTVGKNVTKVNFQPCQSPIENVEDISSDIRVATSSIEVMDYNYNKSYVIISSYEDWKACNLGRADDVYTKAFFETKSLVVCGISLPNSNVKLASVSANKAGSVLNVYYTLEKEGDVGATVMTYKDIIVAVDKNVTSVNVVAS